MTTHLTLATGCKMPIIGLGTWQSKPEEVKQAVLTAIDVGYRLIDTAYVYGNEEVIGEALQEAFKTNKVKREELFITTKLHGQYMHKEDVMPMLKKQLGLLKLTYVDLYLIHTPLPLKKVEGTLFPMEDGHVIPDTVEHTETWQGMEECYKAGLTKHIGLSNFNKKHIEKLCATATVKPHNLQSECHAYWPQFELQEVCKRHGISFTAYGPIGSPGLANFSFSGSNTTVLAKPKVLLEEELVLKLAQKYHKTPAQILLRWLIQRDCCVIPKSVNPERIKENFNVFDFKLDEADCKCLCSFPPKKLFDTPIFKKHPQFDASEPY
jgi:diketogulonate reductase-like aldo/keto reductase